MSKKLLSATGLAFFALTGASIAADVVDAEPEIPANWSGFYVGSDIGYGMGDTKLVISDVFEWNGLGSKGGSVGAFAGYNQQFGDWVAGFEFGGTLSDIQGHTEVTIGGDEYGTQTLTDWSAGILARLGYAVSPSTLLFAGIGGKVVHGIGRAKLNGSTVYEEDDQFTAIGTVSVGIETAISDNWRIRAQYDADLLNANEYGGLEVTPLIGTAKASLIYAFGDDATTAAPADAGKWAGFYAGIVGGQTMGVAQLHIGDDVDYFNHEGLGSSGWTGGAVAGYNLGVAERFLLGVEGGVYASSSRTFIGSAIEEDGLLGTNEWWADARLRAGYLASQEAMIYGFVGLSRMHSMIGNVDDGEWTGGETTLDRNGATFGGGIEAQVADNLLVRAEYAYTALENSDLQEGVPDYGYMSQVQQTATVGLLYRFGE